MKRNDSERGQGSVEFLLAVPIVLLLGLGSLEAIHWFFARQAVSNALMQAGRAAITQHARPDILDAAFIEAMLPVFVAPSPAETRARLERAMARREQATGLPAWRMEILSPSVASFQDFSSSHPDLPALGHSVIDNDYLALQHRDRIASGWAQGRGPKSGQNIVEANTLVLHLTWLHEPLLPGLRQLVKILAPSGSSYGSRAMAVAGYLPIRRQVSLLMQSHPIAGNLPSHGRVVRQGQAAPAGTEGSGLPVGTGAGPGTGPGTARSCTGLWCLDVLSVGRTTGGAPGGKPLTGAPSASEDSDAPPGLKPAWPDSAGEPGTVPPGLPGHDTLPETPHWPPDAGSPPTGQESGGWPGVDDAAGNGFDDAENEAPPLWDDMCPGCCD